MTSQSRAVAAQESGHFDVEIVPVTAPAHKDKDREGNEIDIPEQVVTKDDGPRAGTTLEKLSQLKPAFKPDGTVTAGNACPLNDGAAALLVTSEERAKELGLSPKSRSSPRRSSRSAPRSWGSARCPRSSCCSRTPACR